MRVVVGADPGLNTRSALRPDLVGGHEPKGAAAGTLVVLADLHRPPGTICQRGRTACPFLLWPLDTPGGRKAQTLWRSSRQPRGRIFETSPGQNILVDQRSR